MIDIALLKGSMPALLYASLTTLQIAFFACLIGLVLGVLLAIGQTRRNKILVALITVYTTVIRGTPMLIQIAFMYFVIFPMIGVKVSALVAAILAIGLNSGAYMSQVIRGGIIAVNKGQLEAATVLGFTPWQSLRYIVLPQAFRMIVPALGNEFITLIKDSSLASTIGVAELVLEGKIIISRTYNALTVYLAIALIYLVMTTCLTLLVDHYNRKLNPHAQH